MKRRTLDYKMKVRSAKVLDFEIKKNTKNDYLVIWSG